MNYFEPFQLIKILQNATEYVDAERPGRFVFKWYELDEKTLQPKNLLSRVADASLEDTAKNTWFSEYELLHSPYGRLSETPHPNGMYLEIWKFPNYLKAV